MEAKNEVYESLVPGFGEQVRNFILEDLSLTFANLERDLLCKYLNIEDNILEEVFEEENLTKIAGYVELGKSEQNQPKPKEVETISHLKLQQIQPLMRQILS